MVQLAALALAAVLAAPEADAAKTYRIATDGSTAQLAVGATGKVVLAIEPLGNVHVHPQAPLKITVESSKGLRVEKAQLGRKDAVDPKAEAPRFEVPFSAVEAGKQEARAKVDFFVCSDQWCVKQVKDVAVPVTVTAR
jgi:hypothetical protein